MDSELQQAVEAHRAGRLDEAQACYLSVLQREPGNSDAHHNLGTLYLQKGDADSALPHFLAALESDTSNGQYWIGYIDALHKAGQTDAAIEVLNLARSQGLDGDRVSELAARLAGQEARPSNREIDDLVALFGQGRYTEAAGVATELTQRYPEHEFGWKALGAVYKQMNRAADALYPMQRAAELAPSDVEAHYNLGVTLQELGRLEDAQSAYLRALKIDPDYADAHGNLGVVQQSLGRIAEAQASYRRAISLKPSYASAHYNLGRLLSEAGRFAEAEAEYRSALQHNAQDARILISLGDALKAQHRADEAAACYREALLLDPGNAPLHYNLGNLQKDRGLLDEAEASYRSAVAIDPGFAKAHYNLGALLQDRGDHEKAVACYLAALQADPDYVDAHYNLGNAYRELGRLNDAGASYRDAIALDPGCAKAHNNLGNVLKQCGRLDEAEACYRDAVRIAPDFAEGYCNLGAVLQKTGRSDDAVAAFEAALAIDPDDADAHNGLAITLHEMNRLQEAAAHFRRTLEIRPDSAVAHSNLIFTLELMEDVGTAALAEERSRWNAAHAAPLHRRRSFSNVPDPQRRLRIGYVSADFRAHSAAYAFGAMLTRYDRERFDVYAYSNSDNCDELTRTFRDSVTVWRDIAGLSDDAVCLLIENDGIDILVDLSGHSAGNRLLVFAKKPAPIQVSAFGYAAGTGMDAMDALFSDPVFVPFDEQHFYAERVVYLPSAIGYFASGTPPAVNALPALSNGCLTFGSYNRLVKNSEQAYQAWAKILQAVPGSRMVFKTPALDDAGAQQRVRSRFADMGIDPGRILLLGKTSRDAHMAAFNLIDIALDPFPHGGGVSALEGIVMGVPFVTLRWPTLAGRVSASIATSLDLADWIAQSPDEYVQLATDKARDLHALSELRGRLRGRFNSSAIGDSGAYVRAAEQEYLKLWRQWCARDSQGGV